MTRNEFCQLSKEKKCQYVWVRCTFLATRFHQKADKKARVNLFTNGRFYIEVWYNSPYDYFGDIEAFESDAVLEPYLDTINLQQMLVH